MFCSEADIEFQLQTPWMHELGKLYSDKICSSHIAEREPECGLSNRTHWGAGSILQSSNHRLKCIRKAASSEAA
jgi:hypothetical protein